MKQKVGEPETAQEQELAVNCQRESCVDQTLIPVDVEVGDVTQEWCPGCVKEEFGLDYAEYQKKQESILRYITPATVGSFLFGSLLMLLIASITVV